VRACTLLPASPPTARRCRSLPLLRRPPPRRLFNTRVLTPPPFRAPQTPLSLAGLLWGFSRSGHCPRGWLADGGLLTTATQLVPAMSLPDLTMALEGLCAWDLPALASPAAQGLLRQAAANRLAALAGAADPAASAAPMSLSSLSSYDGGDAPWPTAADGGAGGSGSASPSGGRAPASLPQLLPAPTLMGCAPHHAASLATSLARLGGAAPPGVLSLLEGVALAAPPGALTLGQLTALLYALSRMDYESLPLLGLAARRVAGGLGAPRLLAPSTAVMLLSAFSRFNRPPGPELLQAVADGVQASVRARGWRPRPGGEGGGQPGAAAADAGAGDAPDDAPRGAGAPDLAALLYALAVLRELNGPFALWLAQQLSEGGPAAASALAPDAPEALQLAAVLLSAQAQRASAVVACFPKDARGALLERWRRATLLRATKPPNGIQRDVLAAVKRLGFRCRPNAVSPDGCACPDVVVRVSTAVAAEDDGGDGSGSATPGASTPGAPAAAGTPGGAAAAAGAPAAAEWFALELVGPHNTSVNSQRLLAAAVLKWRLLQARGYRVVPVSCRDWLRMSRGDELTRVLYLQSVLKL